MTRNSGPREHPGDDEFADFPLTQEAIARTERANRADELDLSDDDDPVRGQALLDALAGEAWIDSGSGAGYVRRARGYTMRVKRPPAE
jgi:hypothetical protein